MESILTSIKKMLGITAEYTHFDPDIIMHINSVLAVLNQLGVGPSGGFRIEDDTSTWDELIQDDVKLESVKTYIHLRVKLLFDPPNNSAVIEAMTRTINELEWRLNVTAENN